MTGLLLKTCIIRFPPLTSHIRVFFFQETDSHSVIARHFLSLMKPEGSLLFSHKSINAVHSEPDDSSSHHCTRILKGIF